MYKILLSGVYMLAMISVASSADNLYVSEFSQKGLADWDEKSFSGNTGYSVLNEEGEYFLRADANASASALYKKIKIDLNKRPILNWSWRVDKPIDSLDEQSKQGDDYAARIYVIVKRGLMPWNTLALNYVWSSNDEPLEFWPNAYTDKAIMIPLQNSGIGRQWEAEKVNVKADIKKYLGIEVSHIDAIAIMTDTDNSQLHAIASYRDIYFTSN